MFSVSVVIMSMELQTIKAKALGISPPHVVSLRLPSQDLIFKTLKPLLFLSPILFYCLKCTINLVYTNVLFFFLLQNISPEHYEQDGST